MSIALNRPVNPDLKQLTKYLEQIASTGQYTNFGPLHQLLTERLERFLGVSNLLLVANGTLALQVACKALGIQNILTTPFSFVATASSLLWQGCELTFCDIDEKSYNLCATKADAALNQYKNIDGVVATHVYGNPCDVKAFESLSTDKDLKIVYDAAHAFGVNINGQSVLNFGDASTLSFHATKLFHTVEGGAIVFKNRKDLERAKKLINFGYDGKGNIVETGINAKLNEYQCAVGLTLLEQTDQIIEHRAELFSKYRSQLSGLVDFPEWHSGASINGAYMPIRLSSESMREKVENLLLDNDIQSRRYFSPSLEKVFENHEYFDGRISNEITQEVLCLPLHSHMTGADVDKVIKAVKKSLL